MKRLFRRPAVSLIVILTGITVAQVKVASSEDFDRVQAGPIKYRIPKEYRTSNQSGDSIFIQFHVADWGPLDRDRSGWKDNVNVLITPQPQDIAGQYDALWDGTPSGAPTKSKTIERTYRIEPDFTVQEMGSTYDIVIPDQDGATMPLGLMQCTRPNPPVFPNASCALLFDRDGQRWTVTFGRQFLHRYAEFRGRATTLFDSFREVPR
ncbi:hypothetical protein CFBP4996_26360 (plasmid) [Agrobacterium leguminum]|uniref:hypothetical protein n=1 Tax=Agrobacterium leguminum TaxID=2792015 RepID=UPI0010C9D545|nr:hypothetical protein [Agrobacterium leguminum]WFS69599.1 hypothetical protein CFBP4996_26360 [Agrobacterium leguminum]